MTAVVTGAAGFIGRRLAVELMARGYAVVGVDRRDAMPSGVVPVVADVLSGMADDALREADVVFHLAGAPGVRDTGDDADARRHRDNVLATAHVVDAVPASVPLIVTSSSSVYGGAVNGACAETDWLRPRGSYARSKVEVERLCARRVSRGGHVAVARPFTVAGEGQRADMALARWLAAARRAEPLRLIGGPARTRDVTDVADVVEGLIRMATRGVRSTINLGTGRAVTLSAMVDAVSAATGRQVETVSTPSPDDEPPHTLADTKRCAALLDFVPTTNIADLVRRQARASAVLELL